jgi:hypothetical protein
MTLILCTSTSNSVSHCLVRAQHKHIVPKITNQCHCSCTVLQNGSASRAYSLVPTAATGLLYLARQQLQLLPRLHTP